jgi:hypothetical protein
MNYEAFTEKLNSIKIEFKSKTGTDLTTIEDLEKFLSDKNFSRFRKTRGVKSLKSFGL